MMKKMTVPVFILAILTFAAVGCEDPDNYIEGSITTQYDMSFGSVSVTEFTGSDQLFIEYHRSGESSEKPLMVTLDPVPDGPGHYVMHNGPTLITINNSLLTSNELPAVQSASVTLDAFTPGEEETNVEGTINATFQGEGTGDAFTLDAGFKASLEIVRG